MKSNSLCTFHVGIVLAALIGLLASPAYATISLTYHGRILRPDGSTLDSSNVRFYIEIKSHNDCLLYREVQAVNMSTSGGVFALNIGSAPVSQTNNYVGPSLSSVFTNRGSFTGLTGCTGGTYTPNVDDDRKILVSFEDMNSANPTLENIPAQLVSYVPFAVEAYQISGYTSQNLLRVEGGTTPPLNPANFVELMALLNGTSTQYVTPANNGVTSLTFAGGDFNGGTITSTGAVSLKDVVAGATKGSATKIPQITYDNKGRITSVNEVDITGVAPTGNAGGDFTGTYPNPTIAAGKIDTGKLADDAVTSAKIKDGEIVNADISPTAGIVDTKLATIATAGKVANSATTGTSANTPNTLVLRDNNGDIATRNISANQINVNETYITDLYLRNGSNVTAKFNLDSAATSNFIITWPDNTNSNGKILSNDGTGKLSWVSAASGSMTSITAGTGLNVGAGPGGTISTAGTLNVNVGTGANQIVQLNSSSQLPAVDGSLLANLNPANLNAVVPISKGGTGQSTSTTAFNALSPLTSKGDISTHDGTNNIRLPVGADFKYLRANSSQISGLEYSDVTAVDLASINTTGIVQRTGAGAYSTLGVTAPLVNSGTNIGLSIGSGLKTNAGNLVVDIGTGANQIPQLDAGGKIDPAVIPSGVASQWTTSGSDIHYNTGNVGIGTTAPTEKLEVNGNIKTTQLCLGTDCRSAWPSGGGGGAGTVTNITAGTGLNVGAGPGGSITGTGTLNINVGTGANQIPQLDGSGKLNASVIPTGTLNATQLNTGNWSLNATNWPGSGGFSYNGGDVIFGISSLTGQASLQVDGGFIQGEIGKNNVFLGNVGVGTATPGSKLDVVGDITISNGNYLKQKNAAGTALNILGIDGSNTTRLYSGGSVLHINPDKNSSTYLNYNNTNPVIVGDGTHPTNFTVSNGSVNTNSLCDVAGNNCKTPASLVTSVTGSLGYTPVNKAGDTMTGGLTINEGWSPSQAISITSNNISKTQTAGDSSLYLQYGVNGGAVVVGGAAAQTNNLRVEGSVYAREGMYTNRSWYYLAGFGDTNHAIGNVAGDGEQFRFFNFLDLYQANGGGSRLYINTSGNIGVGTTTPAYKLDVTSSVWGVARLSTTGANDSVLLLNSQAGQNRFTRYTTNNSARWDMGTGSAAESGGNAGSDFFINRFSDTGAYLNTPFQISRATATAFFSNNVNVGGNINVNNICDAGGANCRSIASISTLNYTPVNKAGDSGVGTIDFSNGSSVRFGHANQGDGNDGRIGAGIFAEGLNIVGTQTVAGNGRKITTWGNIYSNGSITSTGNVNAANICDASGANCRSPASIVTTATGATGAGSGLNADLLDGLSNEAFARSDAAAIDQWLSFRVLRNAKAGGDGMFIGYGNSNSADTRIYSRGSTNGFYSSDANGNISRSDGATYYHSANFTSATVTNALGYTPLRFDVWAGNQYFGSDGVHYATMFKDANDGAYYIDPNGHSEIARVRTNSNWDGYQGGVMIKGNAPSITLEDTDDGRRWLIHNNNDTLYFQRANTLNGTDWAEKMRVQSDGNIWTPAFGYLSDYMFKKNDWNGSSLVHTDGRHYGTIFYDSNDTNFYVDPNWISNMNSAYFAGNVGIGTTNPTQKLTVVGTVESKSGGFKFPDGSVQTTAATSIGGMGCTTISQSFWYTGGSVYCPAGKTMMSGGATCAADTGGALTTLVSNAPDGNGWNGACWNPVTNGNGAITVYVRCCN